MAPGGDALSLVAKLRQLEERLRAIDTELANCRPIPRLDPAIIEDRLTQWRRLLRASKTQGRTVLQRVLRGRLIFTPHVNPVSKEIDGYEFEGPTRLYQLLTGLAVERPKGLPDSRAGYEGITHEDTFDSDYGRLLEKRFHAEVLASPTRVVPEWTRKVPGEVKAA